jgi:hypothetical protein
MRRAGLVCCLVLIATAVNIQNLQARSGKYSGGAPCAERPNSAGCEGHAAKSVKPERKKKSK